jgi:hypothetical protein
MMDQVAYGILFALLGLAIAFVVYIGVWMPKEKMKGHAGRGKCKCCNEKVVYHEDDNAFLVISCQFTLSYVQSTIVFPI